MRLLQYILLIFVLFSYALAQDLVTDRPDFTESALSIKAKMVQIESGVGYSEINKLEALTFPNALARIGVGPIWKFAWDFRAG